VVRALRKGILCGAGFGRRIEENCMRGHVRGVGLKMAAMGVLAAAGLGVGGCASTTAYDQHWKDTKVVLASDVTATPLAGKWQGEWHSDDSDYYWGLAKAIIIPVDTSKTKEGVTATRYEAHIQLWHFFIFPEEFKVYLSAVPEGDKITFYGERVMNPIDGVARYDGFLEGDKIVIAYNSIKDYGSFTFRRFTPESPSVNGQAWGPSNNTH
jgi:hypothetical protein